jgi:hypothetical protein
MIWTIKKVMNGYLLTSVVEDRYYTTTYEYVFADKDTLLLHLKAHMTELELGMDAVEGHSE